MDPRIARAIARMEEAIDRELLVAELAASVSLSPARYLHTLRMERARLLLERTFLSVKEVMAHVGVNDPSHFSRDFRRHHGVPPTGLRRRSWAAVDWSGQNDPPINAS